MSSNAFSSDLRPDPAARRIVLCTGVIAALGGIGVIAGLPVETDWRFTAIVLWAMVCGYDLWIVAAGFGRCSRIRIEPSGKLFVHSADNCCSAATLRAGSIVMWQFAWLRFRTENGRRHVELIRRKSAQSKEWRRLQVIWRHIGAGG